MKRPKLFLWMSVATAIALPMTKPTPAYAVTFGQTEVSQNRFVAVAVPRTSGNYTLLVLEQLSSQKNCWREQGANPTRVNPLLLNFNFTGICGRSTDSNGYSIRMAGKDDALAYRLSFQKRKNDLILLGIPNQTGQPIEVGRTRGLNSGFLKIALNSGWRFTKRTYNGKKLGHIYFSRDTTAPTYQEGAIATKPITTQSTSIGSIGIPKKKSSNKSATQSSRQSFESRESKSPKRSSSHRVMVVAPDSEQQAKLRAQRPAAFQTSYKGKSVMQVGVFSDRTKAQSLKDELKNQGFKVLLVTTEHQLSLQ
jgi:hypothetical protein